LRTGAALSSEIREGSIRFKHIVPSRAPYLNFEETGHSFSALAISLECTVLRHMHSRAAPSLLSEITTYRCQTCFLSWQGQESTAQRRAPHTHTHTPAASSRPRPSDIGVLVRLPDVIAGVGNKLAGVVGHKRFGDGRRGRRHGFGPPPHGTVRVEVLGDVRLGVLQEQGGGGRSACGVSGSSWRA
jgi:hypothetical protein